MQIIPLDTRSPRFDLSVVLDGSTYVLHLDYSDRTGIWSLDISLPDGTLLLAGLGLTNGQDVLRTHPTAEGPPGQLLVWDTTGQGRDPDRDTLGNDCLLVYLEAT